MDEATQVEAIPEATSPKATEVEKATRATQVEGDAPRGRMPRSIGAFMWSVILASFVLSATTWIALGDLAGFTESTVVHLRGGATFVPRLAWLMPVVVDGYVVVALLTWMAPVPPEVQRFARNNTYGAAALGLVVQSTYHATLGAQVSPMTSVLSAVIGAMPPGFAALAIHLRTVVIRRAVPELGRSHATHATVELTSAPLARQSASTGAPAATLPKAPRTRTRAPRKATAPAAPKATDELAGPRLAHDVEALMAAWGNEPPAGDLRAAAKGVLRSGAARASAALREYKAIQGEATQGDEATEAAL